MRKNKHTTVTIKEGALSAQITADLATKEGRDEAKRAAERILNIVALAEVSQK